MLRDVNSGSPASSRATGLGGLAGSAQAGKEVAAQRIELVLQQLESLPTLAPIAVRLMELTSDDDSHARDVIALVSADPSLSAKVLRLCRCSDRGRAANVTTVERAVLLLGFEALRSAVLSVQVFELFDTVRSPGGELRENKHIFDRTAFWHHSLAVGSLCETLAGSATSCKTVKKADAFICGLLHDLGTLALHVLLPKSFDGVCELAETHGISLDQACRRIIGLDTHTAGRRLAEHWRLPHLLSDVMWLHGQPFDSLPQLDHRAHIMLVTLADTMARHQGIAAAGHGARGEDINQLGKALGINPQTIAEAMQRVHQEVAHRAAAMGLDTTTDVALLLQSICRANEALGRMNVGMRQRAVLSQQQTQTLHAIRQFHDSAAPGGSVVDMMGKVVESAANVLESGRFFGVLYQRRLGEHWHFTQFAVDGRPLRSELISPPPGSTAVADLADESQVSMQVLSMLPWLTDYLGDASDVRKVHLLPLRCGWGVNAVLLHDCAVDGREAREQLDALGRTWAAAIAAAAQHEGAKRLGEQLAESNLALIEAQDELSRSRALASLGEIAAGAAHEMNNPLTVISGRSQLLASRLTDAELRPMAQQIVEQSHRLSDMITALRLFAEPTRPTRKPVDLAQLLDAVVADVCKRYPACPRINVVGAQGIPMAYVDPEQIGRATMELLRNAAESESCSEIELRVQIEPLNDRLKVQVTDDGSGLSQHALAHAFDPFFSAKPAGRQPGLGLSQAQRLVEAHGGQITLENGKQRGAVATLWLDEWRVPAQTMQAA